MKKETFKKQVKEFKRFETIVCAAEKDGEKGIKIRTSYSNTTSNKIVTKEIFRAWYLVDSFIAQKLNNFSVGTWVEINSNLDVDSVYGKTRYNTFLRPDWKNNSFYVSEYEVKTNPF